MTGHSKLSKLPRDMREEICAMFDAGMTVAEVYEQVTGQGIDTSRAGLGRFRLQWLKAARDVREFERLSEMMVRDFVDAPEEKGTRHIAKIVESGLVQALAAMAAKEAKDPAKNLEAFIEATKAVSALARAERDTVETMIKTAEYKESQEKVINMAEGDAPGIIVTFVPVPTEAKKNAAKSAKKPAKKAASKTATKTKKPATSKAKTAKAKSCGKKSA